MPSDKQLRGTACDLIAFLGHQDARRILKADLLRWKEARMGTASLMTLTDRPMVRTVADTVIILEPVTNSRAFVRPWGIAMSYTLLRGQFGSATRPLQGPEPSGVTVTVLPDWPALVQTLPRKLGRPPDIDAHGISGLREALNALENHHPVSTKSAAVRRCDGRAAGGSGQVAAQHPPEGN
jgi:hypothetical protein